MSYRIHQEVREEEQAAKFEREEQDRQDAILIRNMISMLKRKRPRETVTRELHKRELGALRRALYRLPNPYEKETA